MGLPRPRLVDALIAGAFVVLVIAEASFSTAAASPWLHVAIAGPAMAALAWRREHSLLVAAVVTISNLTLNPEGQLSTLLAVVLISFTVGAENDPPRTYLGLAVVVVPYLVTTVLEGLEPSDLAAALVFLVGPWAVGLATRQQALRVADAEERARQREREHEAQVAAAAAAERGRIARELHDIVSHSISVIAIQTQAVRRRLDPGQSRETADLLAVETVARDALAEMRRLFGVLRSAGESAALTPQPGLSELDRLCEQVRSAGLQVTVQVEGDPCALSPGLDLAAYRIVQEGLTNTLRHSDAQRATVVLTYGPTQVVVAVEDDGTGFHASEVPPDRHGLVGLRERVHLYDGTVEVGPGGRGGTRLLATLPMTRPNP